MVPLTHMYYSVQHLHLVTCNINTISINGEVML